MKKIIFHLDLDSYFASAERSLNPSLIGKPIAVSGGGNRAIVAAASYEARAKGVKAAMPLYKVKQLVPDIVVIKPNYNLYTVLSTKLFDMLTSTYTDQIEIGGIDELYLDVTNVAPKYGGDLKLAKHMQDLVQNKLNLPCSIGISNNKFVAKMSTSLNKPKGISKTNPEDFLSVFGKKDLYSFHGIGRPTERKLNELGIFTIEQLARADENKIKSVLGIQSKAYIDMANGYGSDELVLERNEIKGVSNSITFQFGDKDTREDLLREIREMVFKVSYRASIRNLVGKTIALSLKESGGKEIRKASKQRVLDKPTNDFESLFKMCMKIFDESWEGQSIKFVGVHLTKLEDIFEKKQQVSIFDEDNKTKVESIIDEVNAKFKARITITGKESLLNKKKNQSQSRYLEIERTVKYYEKK